VALLGGIASFLDKYLLGYALGTAAGPSLEPFVQDLANEAWTLNTVLPLEPEVLSILVAKGIITRAEGDQWAERTGIDAGRFGGLVEHAAEPPAVATLLQLLRRGEIGAALFQHGLAHNLIDPQYRDAVQALRSVLLSPQEAANAWQQGFMSEADASSEAQRSGVEPGRSSIQREIAGLPPGAMDGLTLLRRGLIDEATYRQIVREGHTKVKYTDALLGLRQQVLSARDAAELWLRGWVSEAQAKAIGALTGYDSAAMDLLYLNRGRPATTHQVWRGLRHGAKIGPPAAGIEADFLKAIRNSNIRDEYANLLWAQRFAYPSMFILDRLVQREVLTVARGLEILSLQGYEQQDIDAFEAYWSKPAAQASQKWAERARGRLYTVTHNEYQDESIDEGRARELLSLVGATAAEQSTVLTLWNAELSINRLELTPAQIKKVWKSGGYTDAEAHAALVERHMSAEDADKFLAS
jgi:hypothetical protein